MAKRGVGSKKRKVAQVLPSPKKKISKASETLEMDKEQSKSKGIAGPCGFQKAAVPKSVNSSRSRPKQLPKEKSNTDFQDPSSPIS